MRVLSDLRLSVEAYGYHLLTGGLIALTLVIGLQAAKQHSLDPQLLLRAPSAAMDNLTIEASQKINALMIAAQRAQAPISKPTVAQISIQRAANGGFLPVMNWVCTAKQVPCEMLLALAQLESSTGLQQTTKSSAKGIWQITNAQFIARAKKYGPANLDLIASYVRGFDPTSDEGRRAGLAYALLARGLLETKDPRYITNKYFAQRADNEILLARDDNLIVPAVLVVACLTDELRITAEKTGLPPDDTFKYAYLTHVYGGPATRAVLGARKDARKPVVAILAAHYAHRYQEGARLTPTERRKAEIYAKKILVDNGNRPDVRVGAFVDNYIQKYTGLARAIKAQLESPSATP